MHIWGLESNAVENHVEVYVAILRKKLSSIGSNVRIVAVRNLGYHLEVKEGKSVCPLSESSEKPPHTMDTSPQDC
ncbi:MAG: helix-turn-helix domain-containing protein [Oscillospiraceae bacterium]|nr:helix-turn-helix domain-containing protein [Oscillospiraceae bacterium]